MVMIKDLHIADYVAARLTGIAGRADAPRLAAQAAARAQHAGDGFRASMWRQVIDALPNAADGAGRHVDLRV
ncbi:MAG: hypothetical protein Tsb0016_18440 [Sphingomonadales bacterium]